MSKRNRKSYPLNSEIKSKIFAWFSDKEYYLYTNGNNYPSLHGSFPEKVFAGKLDKIESTGNSFLKLEELRSTNKNDWIYGYFSYDLKNEIEVLSSSNPSTIPVSHLGFYVPETIIHFSDDKFEIESVLRPDDVLEEIKSFNAINKDSQSEIGSIISNTSKWQYFDHVKKIKNFIVEGEFYEMNYCIEFSSIANSFNPLQCYRKINSISPMPFSALGRFQDNHLICASPERFLKMSGDNIISQPIKGTIRRSFDQKEDELLKNKLKTSEKEQSENLMIVDLVRNDLAKSACAGSIKVEELFGIYTFKKIHQMISTISATKRKSITSNETIKNAFPMGSMTGAPKIRVMEEIEALEHSSRGLYSGSVGFFEPNGNFDFNVVIRSILYNSRSRKISFHVGSAITYDSDPEYEYNECLLKAESILEALSKQ